MQFLCKKLPLTSSVQTGDEDYISVSGLEKKGEITRLGVPKSFYAIAPTSFIFWPGTRYILK